MNENFRAKWKDPAREHRVNAIIHEWHENRPTQMDAIVDYGFGGVVTNPSHRGSYEDFLQSIPEFAKIVAELEERGLGFWLYDEFGYPSGYAGGETLKGHPELEGKGFYMRRYVAYEPRTVRHHLDCESDKIIWAAKYPIDNPVMHESLVRYDEMTPVPFTDTYVEAELNPAEALFVFCVKPAYEGSQCTHNTCSFSRYINIMNPDAVDRFIELMFEPIEKAVPGVIAKAKAIFTDEPSLMVGYSRDYEEWPYAIAPWVEGLFEKYEARWGESLLPKLPLLFEGAQKGGTTRSRFYQLVGEIIAENYSGRLQAWCKAHGGTFSGHYLGEETLYAHVMYYGSYMSVLQKTGYPGLDVLECVPERYSYSTAKHTQMAARKMGATGTMAEICPFSHIEEFRLAPYANMLGVMGLLYMSGVRVTNSYFTSNWEEFSPEKLQGANGHMSRAQAREFNGYIGRMSTMLEGLQPQTDVFVYYGFEDESARFVPHHSAHYPADTDIDASCKRITDAIFEHGHDFLYTFSKLTGLWNSLISQGREVLDRPMEMNLWRAPTDNDRNIRLEWERARYDHTVTRAYETTWEESNGGVVIRSTMSVAADSVQRIVNIAAQWCISPAGSISMTLNVVRTPEFPELPRFGLRLFLPQTMNQVHYYGLGPVENYADKHQAAYHGCFAAQVDDMHEDYLRLQENGSRSDCDYVILSDETSQLAVCGDAPFAFNASPYTQEELTVKRHSYELEKCGSTVLCLDYAQDGIGSNSCGPTLSEVYRFVEKNFDFKLRFQLLKCE